MSNQSSLFGSDEGAPVIKKAQAARESVTPEEPLAARMRPRTLDEVVGQEHLVEPGRLLRRSMIKFALILIKVAEPRRLPTRSA